MSATPTAFGGSAHRRGGRGSGEAGQTALDVVEECRALSVGLLSMTPWYRRGYVV